MPVSIHVADRNLVLFLFAGNISSSDLRRVRVGFLKALTRGESLDCLTDLSAAKSWEVGAPDVRSAAELVTEIRKAPRLRFAIVAPTVQTFGLSRMFELTLVTNPQVEAAVFRTRPEADEWLLPSSQKRAKKRVQGPVLRPRSDIMSGSGERAVGLGPVSGALQGPEA